MRVCHCVLGSNGKCCQDVNSAPGFAMNQIYTYGLPRRVRKTTLLGGGKAWVVTNHPAGIRYFPTWREAVDYATAGYHLMNTSVN